MPLSGLWIRRPVLDVSLIVVFGIKELLKRGCVAARSTMMKVSEKRESKFKGTNSFLTWSMRVLMHAQSRAPSLRPEP